MVVVSRAELPDLERCVPSTPGVKYFSYSPSWIWYART